MALQVDSLVGSREICGEISWGLSFNSVRVVYFWRPILGDGNGWLFLISSNDRSDVLSEQQRASFQNRRAAPETPTHQRATLCGWSMIP